jgi:hypothetical protein
LIKAAWVVQFVKEMVKKNRGNENSSCPGGGVAWWSSSSDSETEYRGFESRQCDRFLGLESRQACKKILT